MEYQPYVKIKEQLEGLNTTEWYRKLLATREWKNFRDCIVQRDFNRCRKCNKIGDTYFQENISEDEYERMKQIEIEKGSKEGYFELIDDDLVIKYRQYFPPNIRIFFISLQVHHKLYFHNHLPWE